MIHIVYIVASKGRLLEGVKSPKILYFLISWEKIRASSFKNNITKIISLLRAQVIKVNHHFLNRFCSIFKYIMIFYSRGYFFFFCMLRGTTPHGALELHPTLAWEVALLVRDIRD